MPDITNKIRENLLRQVFNNRADKEVARVQKDRKKAGVEDYFEDVPFDIDVDDLDADDMGDEEMEGDDLDTDEMGREAYSNSKPLRPSRPSPPPPDDGFTF